MVENSPQDYDFMLSKLKPYLVFALYGLMRGVQASIIGSIIFALFWIIAPVVILGFADEMTQYVFSRTIVIIVPALIFLGVMGSFVPGALGGILLSILLYSDVLGKETQDYLVLLKGFFIGSVIGLLMWWLIRLLDPLNPPLAINRKLFVFYSITGIISSSIGGYWAAIKLFKDGVGIVRNLGR